MKRLWGAAFTLAGLMVCLGAAAQQAGPPPAGGVGDGTITYTDPAGGTTDLGTYDYGATGWDPGLLTLAGGGLIGGSVMLRGLLRRSG